MKTLKYFVIAFAAISLASCGGKTTSAEQVDDSTATENVTDSLPTEVSQAVSEDFSSPAEIQSAIEEAQKSGDQSKVKELMEKWEQKIAELKASGDTETLKAYAEALSTYYTAHKEALKEYGVDVAELAKSIESASIEKLGDLKSEAKEKANEAVEKAAEKVSEKAQEAAKEEVNKAVDKAKDKLKGLGL